LLPASRRQIFVVPILTPGRGWVQDVVGIEMTPIEQSKAFCLPTKHV
jgi:hypothetical protein